MNGLRILLGTLVLLFGRRLFWLAVGILGFLFGFDWVTYRLGDWPAWAGWLAALGFGALCALGAVFLQRVSFGVGGFLAGGYLMVRAVIALGIQHDPTPPGLFFLLGGVVGAILAIIAVEWVLVALTALVGAAVVAEGIGAGPLVSGLAFLCLALIGFGVQTATLRQRERGLRPSRPA